MGIHADFAAFVEENGELVDSVTFPLGEKVTYRYRGYLIMLDLGKPPEQEQSRVVGVLKDGKFVYVSEFFRMGSAILWNLIPDPKLSDPEILSRLLRCRA